MPELRNCGSRLQLVKPLPYKIPEMVPAGLTGAHTLAHEVIAAERRALDLVKEASSGEFVGDGERQRAVLVRNRWNLRHVESKDLC